MRGDTIKKRVGNLIISIYDSIMGFIRYLLCGVGLLLLASPVLVLGYQILSYLHSGSWNPVSILDGYTLVFAGEGSRNWANNPDAWLGLWNILDFLAVWVVLCPVGAVVTFSLQGYLDDF